MQIILVGTDFNENSRRALEMASGLARKFDAELHLLHVLEPVDDPDSDDPETVEFYKKLESASRKKLADALADLEGLKVASSVKIGPRHPTILATASELKVDLVVLGHHPLSPEEQRIGVSHKAAMTSSIPVLLVP